MLPKPHKTGMFDSVTNVVINNSGNSSELDIMRNIPQYQVNISLGVSLKGIVHDLE